MRLVVTRPQADAERTAAALRARGHDVLLAPLTRIEPLPADLSGTWGAVVITSANAPHAAKNNPAFASIRNLRLYAVGRRSADAASNVGFTDVVFAAGAVRDLIGIIVQHFRHASLPLLYLAGEHRAADLMGELTGSGVAAQMRVVYRAAAVPFAPALIAALKANAAEGVLHFSQRSAELYVAGAVAAGLGGPALQLQHYCLSARIAEPLVAAGARRVITAPHPTEAALIELLTPSAG
ncbi:MAG TPA: uroporphyrinogen-III synthase [Pseudolabrys sp.]|jgi:uroporphyrinogen-III synthase|nr:uroporphyrinogen-III synthase [Pseudolabrys sp.]